MPWPLNEIVQDDQQTTVVLGEGNLMLRLFAGKEIPLQEFLNRDYLKNQVTPGMPENEARLINYISASQMTSYANVFVATTLVRLTGPHSDQLVIRGASDLSPRDLERGNFIFVGSSSSNPWVSLFESKLNFEIVEAIVGERSYFRNKQPRPGKQDVGHPKFGFAWQAAEIVKTGRSFVAFGRDSAEAQLAQKAYTL